ncbi:Hypothetical predicted protein [Octopus vulgaris]|uniref:Uncharacterized protein n=1 Tax=Octopus vulgaris TaxID=6645 RepID=A0AA36FDN3_OCTVU|nr:Hypothetical predicted protein [Octopus vulgaris]
MKLSDGQSEISEVRFLIILVKGDASSEEQKGSEHQFYDSLFHILTQNMLKNILMPKSKSFAFQPNSQIFSFSDTSNSIGFIAKSGN